MCLSQLARFSQGGNGLKKYVDLRFNLRKRIIFIATLATASVLVGCAAVSPPPPTGEGDENSSITSPAFEGPFASELRAAWVDADSQFVRDVLSDGLISDQEWAEVGARMESCFSENGVDFTGFNADGTYGTYGDMGSEDEMNAILDGCESDSGMSWLQPIRRNMASNPDNVPFAEAMRECLKRNKLVPEGYTKEDFTKDYQSLGFGFMGTEKEDLFWACNSDVSFVGGA